MFTMIKRPLYKIVAVIIISALIGASCVFAGEFRVVPIRLELDSTDKIGAITIANDGKDKLDLQMKLMEWTQDASGKDVYTASSDLVYFPKMASVAPGEDQVIRIALKKPDFVKEQTYRLYIDEIPDAKQIGKNSVGLLVAMRFAAPIFVRPNSVVEKGDIESVTLNKGNLDITMTNTGNVYYSVNNISVKAKDDEGKEVFSKEIKGWYVLAGSKKVFTVPLEKDCVSAARLDIEVTTSTFVVGRDLEVKPAMCK